MKPPGLQLSSGIAKSDIVLLPYALSSWSDRQKLANIVNKGLFCKESNHI